MLPRPERRRRWCSTGSTMPRPRGDDGGARHALRGERAPRICRARAGRLLRVEGLRGLGRLSRAALRRRSAGSARRGWSRASAAHWAAIRDVAAFDGRAGRVWRVSVKPSDGPRLADAAGADGGGARLGRRAGLGRWRRRIPTCAAAMAGMPAATRRWCGPSAATQARSGALSSPSRAAWPALSAGLRARFDPSGHPQPRADGRTQGG